MYIPKHYQNKNISKAVEYMRRYSFGLLTSISNNNIIATHLPFLIEELNGQIMLRSHLARVNPQLHGETNVLVVFQGPHAYISPSWYESKQNVPTWNYIAIHVYGKLRWTEDKSDTLKLLDDTVSAFEPAYMDQWRELDKNYTDNMLDHLTAFEIDVTEVQLQEKLSQNKTRKEQKRIIQGLSQNNETEALAAVMQSVLKV